MTAGKAIFIKQGYQVTSYGRGNHDVYEKLPIYNFEMHVALFHEEFSQLQQKYKSIDKKLVKDENHPYLLKFTLEDFYVFVVSHAYKHYICGGTGIRTLADIYVINCKFGKRFDWNYIKSELQELGISEYEQKNRKLAFKIFDKAKKSQNETCQKMNLKCLPII